METAEPAVIVDASGRPARAASAACPRCQAGRDKRVASGGFGRPHDVCGECGYEWQNLTVDIQPSAR
jgi:uncharacterized protein (DUF983 family)